MSVQTEGFGQQSPVSISREELRRRAEALLREDRALVGPSQQPRDQEAANRWIRVQDEWLESAVAELVLVLLDQAEDYDD